MLTNLQAVSSEVVTEENTYCSVGITEQFGKAHFSPTRDVSEIKASSSLLTTAISSLHNLSNDITQ